MIFRSASGTLTDSYLGFPFSGNDNRSSINTIFNRAYKSIVTHSYQTADIRNNRSSEAGNVASASGQTCVRRFRTNLKGFVETCSSFAQSGRSGVPDRSAHGRLPVAK